MNIAARRFLTSGFFFWLVICGLGLWMVLPLRKRLSFGIDLVGGTYITLEVKTDEAIKEELRSRLPIILQLLQTGGKPAPITTQIPEKAGLEIKTAQEKHPDEIILTFETPAQAQEAVAYLKQEDKNAEFDYATADKTVTLTLTVARTKAIKEFAVDGNIEVLRSRLDQLSVAEVYIARQGERNITIELPDVKDPQQAKERIGKPAVLEFKLVEKVGRSIEDILYEYGGELPGDLEILPGKVERGSQERVYYLVPKYTDITGKLLRDARPALGGQTGAQLVVQFQFSPEGGEKFYDLTSKNYGRRLAIVLDNEVISAPEIQAAIRSEGIISGSFTSEQANELALLLKSGAFVAPVSFVEDRQIQATLGQEAQRSGLISCLVGLGLLLVFSVFYYNLSGFFAFIALIYNLMLILVGLAMIKATLTLPGIAGMVLTIGMAIDASILIYERIKEELAAGVATKKAVNEGFKGAMAVILDANITTLIVGIVLYYFGTGPVQGFAITMILGIVSTLITGLFFLRSLFNFYLDTFHVQKLRI